MKHETIEKNVGLLMLLMVFAVSIGGLTQIVPLFFQDVTNTPRCNWKVATFTSAKAASSAIHR
mgnify:CR=1 FL=1